MGRKQGQAPQGRRRRGRGQWWAAVRTCHACLWACSHLQPVIVLPRKARAVNDPLCPPKLISLARADPHHPRGGHPAIPSAYYYFF